MLRCGNRDQDPMRSLRLRCSTSIPALLNVKTACSLRGIVLLTPQPSHREGHMPVNIGRRELIATLGGGRPGRLLRARSSRVWPWLGLCTSYPWKTRVFQNSCVSPRSQGRRLC